MLNVKLTPRQARSRIGSVINLPKTWEEALSAAQPNYHFNAISKCGRDAYVDTDDKVERLKLQLLRKMHNAKQVVTSKFAYHSVYEDWKFTYLPWSASITFSRLKSLFQSGIVTLWRLWKFRVETYNDTVIAAQSIGETFRALTLSDSNLVVVFYVHAFALGVTIPVFLIENSKRWIKSGKEIGKKLFASTQVQTFS